MPDARRPKSLRRQADAPIDLFARPAARVQVQPRDAFPPRRDEGRRDDGRRDEGRRDDGRRDEGRRDDGRRGGDDRRALSAMGGPTRVWGDAKLGAILAEALDDAGTQEADVLTHGFHSYPARMHPAIARVVIEKLSKPGDVVVDPFCGSGTVLVEAQRLGRRGAGVDLNPLALRVAEVKCDAREEADRDRFAETLDGIVENSKERVRERAPSNAPLSRDEATRYEGHVLREMGGLYEEIESVANDDDRRAFEVVLSSLVTKLSKQRADTSEQTVQKKIGRYIPTEMFAKKGQELVERWAEYDHAVPKNARKPRLILGDARTLPKLLDGAIADLIVTSPPYAGTYDYAQHHVRRMPWLGLDATTIDEGEIGARRHAGDGLSRWDRELREALTAMAQSTRKGGTIVLLIGDGELEGMRVPAEPQVRRLAPLCGLSLDAGAAQRRADWHGGADREEHLLLLHVV
jgi:DNA modification methylase